ncbi:hypothetical protein PanWU01x14_299400 [Parasponia andersonii]|uniref:Uncharacterized protein n=1 Tax=Parasponia andersonii TaxID=3476 RepID=A0A2P5AUD7_PARAD|nr:hypothetical protein PanWU01x14_299400 [Parasponia andersonii]
MRFITKSTPPASAMSFLLARQPDNFTNADKESSFDSILPADAISIKGGITPSSPRSFKFESTNSMLTTALTIDILEDSGPDRNQTFIFHKSITRNHHCSIFFVL